MQIVPDQPASIAKVLYISIKLYGACFGKLMGLILALTVFLVSLGLFSDLVIGMPETGNEGEGLGFLVAKLPLLLSVVFVLCILSFVLYSSMIYRIDNVVNQREDTVLQALQFGLEKFLPMLVAVIVYSLAVTVGLALFVIPGLILSLSLAFYLYFIVIENRGGYASLRASHDLVWGYWWRTMSVFSIPGAVLVLFYSGLFIALGLMGGGLDSPPGPTALFNAFGNILSALITPYFFTLGYVQYHDLKLRQNGTNGAGYPKK